MGAGVEESRCAKVQEMGGREGDRVNFGGCEGESTGSVRVKREIPPRGSPTLTTLNYDAGTIVHQKLEILKVLLLKPNLRCVRRHFYRWARLLIANSALVIGGGRDQVHRR
jgi:hypothetical protein